MAREKKLPAPVPPGTTARYWVSGYEPGDTVDWRSVDVAALRAYPKVLSTIDPKGRYHEGKRYERLPFWVWPLFVVMLAAFGSPIWAFSTLFSQGWRSSSTPFDWTTRLPVAGVLYGIALVITVVLVVGYFVAGRRGGIARGYSGVLFALGLLSSFGLLARGDVRAEVLYGDQWMFFILAATGIAGVSVIVLLVFRERPALTDDGEKPSPTITAFRKLPPREQEAVQADIREALDDLEARNVIDAEQAASARRAEPGMLRRHAS
ncbi:hypothetical protein [Labedella endophytica]|uniref:Uncharacterized protein n=1 Tax=Labedella endophytica TaxID=1523160 RepID=A0A433JTQ0_9MICO|nr:hypothetical protein [Labedella endophytica]RUR01580.1 hypothetical protein ELQ94_08825 [Labedella endophytica]